MQTVVYENPQGAELRYIYETAGEGGQVSFENIRSEETVDINGVKNGTLYTPLRQRQNSTYRQNYAAGKGYTQRDKFSKGRHFDWCLPCLLSQIFTQHLLNTFFNIPYGFFCIRVCSYKPYRQLQANPSSFGSFPFPCMLVACSPHRELLYVRSYAGESFHLFSSKS